MTSRREAHRAPLEIWRLPLARRHYRRARRTLARERALEAAMAKAGGLKLDGRLLVLTSAVWVAGLLVVVFGISANRAEQSGNKLIDFGYLGFLFKRINPYCSRRSASRSPSDSPSSERRGACPRNPSARRAFPPPPPRHTNPKRDSPSSSARLPSARPLSRGIFITGSSLVGAAVAPRASRARTSSASSSARRRPSTASSSPSSSRRRWSTWRPAGRLLLRRGDEQRIRHVRRGAHGGTRQLSVWDMRGDRGELVRAERRAKPGAVRQDLVVEIFGSASGSSG